MMAKASFVHRTAKAVHTTGNLPPSGPMASNSGRPTLNPYQALIRGLSDRLLQALRPIRVLDALKWEDDVERAFFAAGARELPPVSTDYYRRRPLPFDPGQKRREFQTLERDVRRKLGKDNPAGQILTRRCVEYREVVDLLAHRGTPSFAVLSRKLYGSAADRLHANEPSLAELARTMAGTLDHGCPGDTRVSEEPVLKGSEAVQVLAGRLASFFGDEAVQVRLADGLIADAVAGSDYIKLRAGARFTPRELRLLEVHEGWVHLGTTRNGQSQPVCTFLCKGPPSATLAQEGLAVVTEILAFASHPARVRRLAHRIEALARAEAGADFLDVYRFFLSQGYAPRMSYYQAVRIFRGSLPAGCGPFTKDLCYHKGLVLVYHFLRGATAGGLASRILLLFCGKTSLEDVPALGQLAEEGLLAPPRFLPPPFADPCALSAWLCYTNFLGCLSPGLRVTASCRCSTGG
jgi:uncharacterized protein (TIGR02421 family)